MAVTFHPLKCSIFTDDVKQKYKSTNLVTTTPIVSTGTGGLHIIHTQTPYYASLC